MANIKSAEKRIHIAERKRLRNKTRLSRLRTAIKKFGAAGGTTKTGALPSTHSEIDRALAKGVIHRNAAARYKSRLAKSATAK